MAFLFVLIEVRKVLYSCRGAGARAEVAQARRMRHVLQRLVARIPEGLFAARLRLEDLLARLPADHFQHHVDRGWRGRLRRGLWCGWHHLRHVPPFFDRAEGREQ